MASSHVVVQGDCINSIAAANGFFPDTLWNHEDNKALREKRKDPNALLAGDVIKIPDLRDRVEEVTTGKRHTFKRKGVPAVFRLQIFGANGKAANEAWIADVDGTEQKGTSDANGVVALTIKPNAKEVKLKIAGEEHVFHLGTIDPLSEVVGLQGRLSNLGYGPLEPTGTLDEPTVKALKAFQRAVGVEPTGEVDDTTRDHIARLHDTVTDHGPDGVAAKEAIPDERGEESDDDETGDDDLI